MWDWMHVFKVFLLSMTPVFELRGAIAFGPIHGIPWGLTLTAAVLGNCVPVPFVLVFGKRLFTWLKHRKRLAPLTGRIAANVEKNRDALRRNTLAGLFILVAIPLPGTGAWTGSLVAAILGVRVRHALAAIVPGILTAGILMTAAWYGGAGFLQWLQ